ncbi:hypothetical protein RA086_08645 [Lactiplantibacillus sp. WILCCON 0030]|uniref:Type II secretion system protein n=1 Tax=Lactiplantibacillus brownii TaxID=3069269 RepID=A0ABU1A9S3_9LACO|nr:hypothetical protein [Lactiplantibacillus brownii]MDQ7937675.1 hypothetical protein [Lactiplantibacillus brownii]
MTKYQDRRRHHGFILAETVLALAILVTGVSLSLGLETLMIRQERRQVQRIKQARYDYERVRLAQFDLRPLATGA